MNKKGIIYKAQKELYYVLSDEKSYKSKARGIFRDKNIKPLVGDQVEISILSEDEALIVGVSERKSQLIRPPVANVDQIILVLTLKSPNLNYTLLDKYLVMLEHFDLDLAIVFNKIDLINQEEIDQLKSEYEKSSYKLFFTSTIENLGVDELKDQLAGKISALAGPSGVGKSSLINLISDSDRLLKTASISSKTKRGRHTTRHTELFKIFEDTYILDTPGFSSLDLSFIEDENMLRNFYPEFVDLQDSCKFQNCQHIMEPSCAVKDAVSESRISKRRYQNYLLIREEIKKNRRY
ncbi:MAG: ribosome small subunit-dependent GTPase A [Tissierellia bacterium]|nr:ribosome small subunit-dependent GTPase A [Tissierellia bacterium]